MTALDRFAAECRWVAWRNEMRGGKTTKVPYAPDGRHAKADEPSTWGTRPEVEIMAARIVNGIGGGIGIQLGDVGHDLYLAGIDLDSCINADGVLADWAAALLAAMPSYAERSPSGTGIKALFHVIADDVRPFLNQIGVVSDAWGTRRTVGANGADHGPAVEIYFAGRYFAITEQLWAGQPDRLTVLDWSALERLAALVPPPRSKATDGSKPTGDDSRSAIAFRKGTALRREGKTFDAMCESLRADPETGAWYLEKGLTGGMRELKRIWEKSGDDSGAAEIQRLASLPRLARERERREAAKRLHIRTTVLDDLVKDEHAKLAGGGKRAPGRPVELFEPEPWPEAVDGAALLDELTAIVQRYVILPIEAARTVALWVLFTHAFAAANFAPKLLITSPLKRCGKTRALEMLSYLVPRPLMSSRLTAATIFRVIEDCRPCLLIDEADTFVHDNEALRGALNSGFSKETANVLLAVKVGDAWEVQQFSTFAAQAVAYIGQLPDTITDRGFVIELKRKLKTEEVLRLRARDAGPLRELARKAARWTADHEDAIRDAEPEMPTGLNDRAADGWEACIAIADVAGGEWPKWARETALALSGDGAANDSNTTVQLLGDLRDLFYPAPTEENPNPSPKTALFSSDIVAALAAREDRPWVEYKKGKAISARQVAQILKHVKVPTNRTIRVGGRHDKGYEARWFTDAFARYLGSPNIDIPPFYR